MTKQLNSQPRKQSSSKASKCPACDEDADGTVLKCDLCSYWFHAECVSLDKNSFDVIAKIDQLWFCPSCKSTGKKPFVIEKQISILEKRFGNMEKTFNDKFDSLATFLSDQLQNLNENRQAAFPTTAVSSPVDINKLVVDSVRDALEAEGKKTTAVLENFPSENDDDQIENIEEVVTAFVQQTDFDVSKIVGIRRSGPVLKSYKTGEDLPRIIKVKCDSETSKIQLIKAVSKFAEHGKVSKVYARPDRTWQQREKLRRLNTELGQKRAAGENYWYIDRYTYELKKDDKKFIERI